MPSPLQDDRATVAYMAMLAAAAGAGAIAAFAVIGWFGVGLVGLTGLWFVNDYRMVQRDEHGDLVYPGRWRTPYADALYECARQNLREQLAAEGRCQQDVAAERAYLRYLKNTIFLALLALGLAMVMTGA